MDHTGRRELVVRRLDDMAVGQLVDSRFPDLVATGDRILAEAEGRMQPTPAAGAARRPQPGDARIRPGAAFRAAELSRRTRQLLLRMAIDGTRDVRELGAEESRTLDFVLLAFLPPSYARLTAICRGFKLSAHRVAHRRGSVK